MKKVDPEPPRPPPKFSYIRPVLPDYLNVSYDYAYKYSTSSSAHVFATRGRLFFKIALGTRVYKYSYYVFVFALQVFVI